MEVEFNDDVDIDVLRQICERLEGLAEKDKGDKKAYYGSSQRIDFIMDLQAANGVNGNAPLDYDRLLDEFDDFNFMHDCMGIQRHMNRETGEIMNCFMPRCSA